ncbi:dentin sialophosphoprotein isoform X2 [Bradysia coprophila]|uniref:dentin sialophosphoprotein isoform X2 n=1 Tax=Bradysia coprophila TaxID=38358 RepID=UPI00187DCA6D|nr:dentin sialophosphoprotein isoform X2 [Bradysia coprophila]
MGVMLSVLCSYMGAIELVFIVRDVTHQLALHQMRSRNGEEQSDISVLQNRIRASISALETVDTESVEQMQDGVSYQNGYRIENERSVQEAAQQWDERRKAMCVAEVNVTLDSQHKSTVSQANGIQNERTKNLNDEPNEQNNYRPIVRDDRTGRRKAFKKRNSSSSSSDSIRLSREEELKMFTSLEEEEYRNSSFTPISYSNASPANSQKIADPPFHEKQKFDAEAWGNRKPSNYHDSALWKRERATSIVEESEDISHSPLPNSSSKRPVGTADKPSSKTSHEKDDEYASVSHACESIDEIITEENPDVVHEPNHMIKKVDNLPNLNHYFNDALMSEVEETNKYNVDTPMTPMSVDKPFDYLDTKSRDARSSTVYSRSDSDSSSLYRKSNSRDSSSNTEYDYPRYDRTDSTNSFIQDELDSEEYHHHHRFSMTAEALEYIRGRDDWRDHTENILNNRYRRQSSNIRIREQIDSDEYHHDRKLSDLVEIAYLDAETIKSLPSSFNEGDMFDRYYLELQQIKGQLSNDIEQNVAQKQVILLDSSEIETAEGYVYPLPDIILDQVSDNDDETYAVEQIDSDYSNLSESEDDIQSVIEVNHSNSYEGEVITTLNMDGDDDELIEVTLWDIHDDITIEHSSKESSVEIISLPNEYQIGDQIFELETASNTSEVMSESIESNNLGQIANKDITSNKATDALSEQSKNSNIETGQDASKKDVKKPKRVGFTLENNAGIEVQTATNDSKNSNTLQEESQTKSESSSQVEDKLLGAVRQNINQRSTSAGMESSKSFIAHESSTSAQESSRHTTKTAETPKIVAERKKEIDDLIKEGSMGVWFH